MGDEVRPLPAELPTTLRADVMERLKNLDGHALSLSVDYDSERADARLMFMVKEPSGWSFAGWAEHNVKSHHTAAGFEIRKVWGQ